jgi:hypothetical protein
MVSAAMNAPTHETKPDFSMWAVMFQISRSFIWR